MNSILMLSGWGRKVGKGLMEGMRKKRPDATIHRWNIVRGDLVQVIQGPQTGQQGKVVKVLRSNNRLLIDGVNMRRRIVKSKLDQSPGKIITRSCTVHYSNVLLVDPSTGKPTKVSRRYLEDGSKVRISKSSGHIIPKPDPLAGRKPRSLVEGAKDTKADDVLAVTFADYEKFLPYIYNSKK